MPGARAGRRWLGLRVEDAEGARVGTVEDIYVDQESGLPQWLLVRLRRFRTGCTLVPLPSEGANGGSSVTVPVARDVIRRAPPVERGGALSQTRELALCAHYGLLASRGAAIESVSSRDLTAIPASVAPVQRAARD
jgi:sporulation protein YlmC with PRC-barrel domain